MAPEPQNENVEVSEKELIKKQEAEALNRKTAAVAAEYFKAMSSLTADEIYELAFTDAGQESQRLLEIVNEAYAGMVKVGGDLPQGHFDNYKKLVSDFNNTLVFNINSKLDSNKDSLIAIATGKTKEPEKISHKDIIDALTK